MTTAHVTEPQSSVTVTDTQVTITLASGIASQPLDPTLTALAGTTVADNEILRATGADAFETKTLSDYGCTLIDDTDAATARATLQVMDYPSNRYYTSRTAWADIITALAVSGTYELVVDSAVTVTANTSINANCKLITFLPWGSITVNGAYTLTLFNQQIKKGYDIQRCFIPANGGVIKGNVTHYVANDWVDPYMFGALGGTTTGSITLDPTVLQNLFENFNSVFIPAKQSGQSFSFYALMTLERKNGFSMHGINNYNCILKQSTGPILEWTSITSTKTDRMKIEDITFQGNSDLTGQPLVKMGTFDFCQFTRCIFRESYTANLLEIYGDFNLSSTFERCNFWNAYGGWGISITSEQMTDLLFFECRLEGPSTVATRKMGGMYVYTIPKNGSITAKMLILGGKTERVNCSFYFRVCDGARIMNFSCSYGSIVIGSKASEVVMINVLLFDLEASVLMGGYGCLWMPGNRRIKGGGCHPLIHDMDQNNLSWNSIIPKGNNYGANDTEGWVFSDTDYVKRVYDADGALKGHHSIRISANSSDVQQTAKYTATLAASTFYIWRMAYGFTRSTTDLSAYNMGELTIADAVATSLFASGQLADSENGYGGTTMVHYGFKTDSNTSITFTLTGGKTVGTTYYRVYSHAQDPVINLLQCNPTFKDAWVDGMPSADWVLYYGTVKYYLNDTASGVGAYYNCQTTETAGDESSFSAAGLSGSDNLVASWITPSTDVTQPVLAANTYTVVITADRTAGTKTIKIYWTLSERTSGGSETVIMTSSESSAITTKAAKTVTATLAANYTITSGSRLVLKIYCNVTDVGDAPTCTLYAEGTLDSYFELANVVTTVSADTSSWTGHTGMRVSIPKTGHNANSGVRIENLSGLKTGHVYEIGFWMQSHLSPWTDGMSGFMSGMSAFTSGETGNGDYASVPLLGHSSRERIVYQFLYEYDSSTKLDLMVVQYTSTNGVPTRTHNMDLTFFYPYMVDCGPLVQEAIIMPETSSAPSARPGVTQIYEYDGMYAIDSAGTIESLGEKFNSIKLHENQAHPTPTVGYVTVYDDLGLKGMYGDGFIDTISTRDVNDMTPLIWLDASNHGSITDAGGGACSGWENLATAHSGDVFAQSTPAARPTIDSDNDCVTFDGSNDCLIVPHDGHYDVKSTVTGLTIYAVYKANTAQTGFIIANMCSANRWWALGITQSSTQIYHTAYILGSSDSDSSNKFNTGTKILVELISDATKMEWWLNGEYHKEFAVSDSTPDEVAVLLGARRSSGDTGSTSFFAGSIYEIVVFDRTLSTAERDWMESYLVHKWGITLD